MNTPRHNPNIRRFGFPLALTAALLGGTACTANKQPTPPPTETTTSAAGMPVPSCVIKAEVNGRVVTFGLDTTNEFEPGVYAVEKAEYTYGDGISEDNGNVYRQPHTYAKAGSYAVNANLIMDVAPGTEVHAPFPDGYKIPCSPTTVTVG